MDYTAEKGGTIITLLPAALEKLSVGEHTVTVHFDNGEVSTVFTVKANSGNSAPAQTGGNGRSDLRITLIILSLCGLAAMLFIGRKKRIFYR